MRKLFCFDTHDINLIDIAEYVQTNLGLILHVKPGGKELHGVLFGNHFEAGYKTPQAYNKGKYWCNESLDEKAHTCVVLVLYETVQAVGGIVMPSGQVPTVTQKPHPKLQTLHLLIPQHITGYAAKNGLAVCHHDAEALKSHLDFFVALR